MTTSQPQRTYSFNGCREMVGTHFEFYSQIDTALVDGGA
jgi:hypothetical protein